MKGDKYFCRTCEADWTEENKGATFCPYCYSKDIVNISEKEREAERKKKDGEAAKKRKEAKLESEKQYRRELIKNREKKLQYYRGKN